MQPIEIEDLRDPALNPVQRIVRRLASSERVDFTVDSILDSAVKETGLHHFGALDFQQRLQIWLTAVGEDRGAAPILRAYLRGVFVRYAANRLRLEDFVRRHPEALDVRLERPIIIAGLPRSGTTHLLRLLSVDSRLRSLPWWEGISPIPDWREEHHANSLDARRAYAQRGWQRIRALLPHMVAMHEVTPDGITEDTELQSLDFSSYMLEWQARVPRWRDYYLTHDQTPTYRYLARAFKVLSFLRGPNRWLTKCPQHLEQLGAIRDVFPDALVVLTHRDPVASIQSVLTMICYNSRLFRERVEPHAVAAYWVDRYETMLRRCVRDRLRLPDSQVVDVHFNDLVARPESVLASIYAKAGLSLGAAQRQRFEDYLRGNPRGKHGQVMYHLARDFAFTPHRLRERFQFYLDRFPARSEVP